MFYSHDTFGCHCWQASQACRHHKLVVCTQAALCREDGSNDTLPATAGTHTACHGETCTQARAGVTQQKGEEGPKASPSLSHHIYSTCPMTAPWHVAGLTKTGPTIQPLHASPEASETSCVTVAGYLSKTCFFQVNRGATWLLFRKLVLHALVFVAEKRELYCEPCWPFSREGQPHFSSIHLCNADTPNHAWCSNILNAEVRNVKKKYVEQWKEKFIWSFYIASVFYMHLKWFTNWLIGFSSLLHMWNVKLHLDDKILKALTFDYSCNQLDL